ncbi:hypothetical protein, partial [Acidithiobacillus sp.]|uniref:hypothetical protein n=1 Tax=Acidithiobacillus sp. TaxID=1872118 RepID=UPI0025B8F86B
EEAFAADSNNLPDGNLFCLRHCDDSQKIGSTLTILLESLQTPSIAAFCRLVVIPHIAVR